MHSPIIRRTIEALDRFGVQTRQHAVALMDLLKWRKSLSTDDVEYVLTFFPDIPEQHYHREDDETGEPLPEGVDGFGLGRHARD